MSRRPQNPYQDPFSNPTAPARLDSESDMDHYDRRETFQSENSAAGGGYDHNNYDYCQYFFLP
jgi:hypothetical protein